MHTLYEVQAWIDDLHRRAEQERLAAIVWAGRPNRVTDFYQYGRHYLEQGISWLGSRLHKPVQQPAATCRTTPDGNTALVLSECC